MLLVLVLMAAGVGAFFVGRSGLLSRGEELSKSFSYDISSHRTFERRELAYRECGSFGVGMHDCRSVAVGPNNSIAVAGDQAVLVFSPNGKLQQRYDLDQPPVAIAFDGNALFVCMKNHVRILSPVPSRWDDLDARAQLCSIVAHGPDVFVADAGNAVVLRYSSQGKLLNRIGLPDQDKGIGGFVLPSPHMDVAIAPDGLLRVVNPGKHLIEAYTFQGDLEYQWGTSSLNQEGFSGCCNPAAMTITSEGRIVTAEKGELATVKIFHPDGPEGAALEALVAGPEQFKDLRRDAKLAPDVAVDSTGRILVLDPARKRVRVFVLRDVSVEPQPSSTGASDEQ